MNTIYDQSGNGKHFANCVANTYSKLWLSSEEYNVIHVRIQGSPMVFSYNELFSPGRTIFGGFDFPEMGYFSMGQVNSCNFELFGRRIFDTLKFNIQTCNNVYTVAGIAGEAIGVIAGSYSYGPNNYFVSLQGKKTTDMASSGWTFAASGMASMGSV